MTPGAAQLAALDADVDRLRITSADAVATAVEELRAASSSLAGAIMLGEWTLAYPRASAQLLRVVGRDADLAAELAPIVLAMNILEPEDSDTILVTAFPKLSGPYRAAAADRDGVRRRLRIDQPIEVSPPEPSWLWPSGTPFPAADTISGVQARLNYLDLGAGPVDGVFTERTRRAWTRWEVLRGLVPTGELDPDTITELGLMTPEAPE